MAFADRDPRLAFARRQMPAGARDIAALRGRAAHRPRPPDPRLNIARCRNRIDHVERLQTVERRGVIGQAMIGLPPARLPFEAEPSQIFENAGFEFGPAARAVDILIPQQEAAAGVACTFGRVKGAVGMAEMQAPGWARRKSGHRLFRIRAAHTSGPIGRLGLSQTA